MVLLLMAYFDEREEMMLCNVEDTCLAGEVQTDKLPLTPTIIVCGKLISCCYFFHVCITLNSLNLYVHECEYTCVSVSLCISVYVQKCFVSITICFFFVCVIFFLFFFFFLRTILL